MKTLRRSPAAKAAAWLLLVLAAFSMVFCALRWAFLLDAGEEWRTAPLVRAQLGREFDGLLRLLQAQEGLARAQDGDYAQRLQYQRTAEQLGAALGSQETNFRYRLLRQDGMPVATNLGGGEEFQSLYLGSITLDRDAGSVSGRVLNLNIDWMYSFADAFGASAEELPGEEPPGDGEAAEAAPEVLVAELGIADPAEFAAADELSHLYHRYHGGMGAQAYLALAGVAGLWALAAFLFLLWAAGRGPGEEEIRPIWLHRVWFELYLAAAVGGAALLVLVFAELLPSFFYYGGYSGWTLGDWDLLCAICAALSALGAAGLSLVGYTLTVRLNARTLISSTLTLSLGRLLCRGARDFLASLPVTWKGAAGFLLFLFLSFLARELEPFRYYHPIPVFLLDLVVLGLLARWLIAFHRVRKGSAVLAGGNLTHRIETGGMPLTLRRQAEDLNNISRGLSAAVEEQMKSERFKAELITNVSHDLKTPLTSIINYVDLLKTTRQDDPRALEYIEVLERKSLRLKKLTEDLVEASKAATGALRVNREKVGMGQLLEQALGEHKEKLETRGLTVVTALPEGETWVYADGRHLWRVLDNLLSNCAKYALEGTRVYIDLQRGAGQVTLSLKNISREPLNLPPEQLMERFVRGEESRTTEGSGLGLSIARSLTELQGGEFRLAVDGDLFKVTVILPQAV